MTLLLAEAASLAEAVEVGAVRCLTLLLEAAEAAARRPTFLLGEFPLAARATQLPGRRLIRHT